jgi:hypothetical protein
VSQYLRSILHAPCVWPSVYAVLDHIVHVGVVTFLALATITPSKQCRGNLHDRKKCPTWVPSTDPGSMAFMVGGERKRKLRGKCGCSRWHLPMTLRRDYGKGEGRGAGIVREMLVGG